MLQHWELPLGQREGSSVGDLLGYKCVFLPYCLVNSGASLLVLPLSQEVIASLPS